MGWIANPLFVGSNPIQPSKKKDLTFTKFIRKIRYIKGNNK